MTQKSIFIPSSYIAKNVTHNFALIKNLLFFYLHFCPFIVWKNPKCYAAMSCGMMSFNNPITYVQGITFKFQ